jgi:glycosyltransferase involved in cell wall biosynthesis
MSFSQSTTQSPMRPVHVLHILEATIGGTMRYMENIAAATEKLNLVCAFAYGTSRADSKLAPFIERIKKHDWQIFPIDMRREINASKDIAALRQLRKVVKTFAPDIVHCHSSKAGALGRAASTSLLSKQVLLYSPHAIAAPLGSKYLKIEKLLARFTDRFIAVSDSEQQQIVDLRLATANKVDIIYPSIDFEHFTPIPKTEARELLGLATEPIVVTIGRLTEQKAPEAFVEIIERLSVQHPNVRGIWVGSGESEKAFRGKIAAAGLTDRITIVPWVHDVRLYIAASDVLLSTSKFESFGYVSAEALAMHRPVVASNVTGTCDIMRDSLAEWLYRFGDYDAAAKLLSKLIESPDVATDIAVVGRSLMQKRFSTTVMRAALADAYIRGLSDIGHAAASVIAPKLAFASGSSIPVSADEIAA